jgi:hypothetical protein
LKSILDQETRATQRVQGSIDLTFTWNGTSHSCEVGDLSLTGLLASIDLPIPAGERVEMQISLGASSKLIRVVGEVVRRVLPGKRADQLSSTGIGIRFISFKGDARERIESWVARTSDSSNKMAYYL